MERGGGGGIRDVAAAAARAAGAAAPLLLALLTAAAALEVGEDGQGDYNMYDGEGDGFPPLFTTVFLPRRTKKVLRTRWTRNWRWRPGSHRRKLKGGGSNNNNLKGLRPRSWPKG